MFENLAEKIKIIARVILGLGVILGAICIIKAIDIEEAMFVLYAILIVFISWMASVFICGFAELLEYVMAIAMHTRGIDANVKNISSMQTKLLKDETKKEN